MENMCDVIFYEAFEEEQVEIKNCLSPAIKAIYTPHTIAENKDDFAPAKVISIRTQSIIPDEWVSGIDAVLTRSQGYDHLIRMFESTQKSVALGYLGSYCERAVAEHAMMAMLALLRNFKRQMVNFKTFHRDGLTGEECPDRKTLVLGVGHIGSQIVELAKAFGMQVKGVDINPVLEGLEYVSLDDGLSWADILFCALPLTPLTQRMLNYERLKNSRNQMLLINISRGEITPIDDLVKLLDQNILRGVSLDVYENESDVAQQFRAQNVTDGASKTIMDLANRYNVIFTPHNAFNTKESVLRKARNTARSIEVFLQKGEFPCEVPLK